MGNSANGAGREDKGCKGWLWGDIKLDDMKKIYGKCTSTASSQD